jgi:hypothetical protein
MTHLRVENFKYLGVIVNEDNNNRHANETYIMLQNFLKIKTYQRNQN